jgi:hypothetical protein
LVYEPTIYQLKIGPKNLELGIDPKLKTKSHHILSSHVLLPPSLSSSYQQVDIMLLVDGIHTLVNMVIAKPTRANLLSLAILSLKVTTMMMA